MTPGFGLFGECQLTSFYMVVCVMMTQCAVSKPLYKSDTEEYPQEENFGSWSPHSLPNQWSIQVQNSGREQAEDLSQSSNHLRHHLGIKQGHPSSTSNSVALRSLKVNPQIPTEIRRRFLVDENETDVPWGMEKGVYGPYSDQPVKHSSKWDERLDEEESLTRGSDMENSILAKKNSKRFQRSGRCLQKMVRKVMKQTCKQYINLKRLKLLKQNRMDLSDHQVKKRMKNCLILFDIFD